ncbi:MAG: peptide chain release factor N(5)-glutamine methyltransferase [Candidatus Aminicenantes bacterium]|nr:peptide chain release factor N(5)-glutamine methyltransferase [Candidatus Aminicenantes bacterium]
MNTLQELIQKGKSLLKEFPHPHLETKLLLLKCFDLSEEEFFASKDKSVSRSPERCFNRLISRRLAGVPLPYLTGIKEFWSIPLRVSPGVLIPRPETELLVEKTIELSKGGEEIIVDLGTGCGNIAVSLAQELPKARIFATDTSRKALRLARLNANLQAVSGVTIVRGSLFSPLERLHLRKECDFIVSNPPYVSQAEWEKLSRETRDHEPRGSLVAGETGLEVIEQVIQGALPYLKPGGYLIIEMGYNQRDAVQSIFDACSSWEKVKFFNDLAGVDRAAAARSLVFS